ncbi:MAG TPA: GNAT family N-acetyltransferase [Natronosporangium sp.]
MSDAVSVTNNPAASRYEAWVGDQLAGFSQYVLADGLITFFHTEVRPAFEGRGIGGAIARFALDDVAASGDRKVVPRCRFIRGWIDRHPEYRRLVDPTWPAPPED